ncbi:hypothetical protein MTR67_053642 [Solanum verrucosum]|uniref:Uncharacterized protein n=1 Tax=Solanum verrucosum TaxID=315347 RepID=A0AAF1A105_SOLVR|nr:hypothetical protein MTR67_053642 [Solanum verrucosum]
MIIKENRTSSHGKALSYVPPSSKQGKPVVTIVENDLKTQIEIVTPSATFQHVDDYEWQPSFNTECLHFGNTMKDFWLSNPKPHEEPFQEVPKKKKRNRRRKRQPRPTGLLDLRSNQYKGWPM